MVWRTYRNRLKMVGVMLLTALDSHFPVFNVNSLLSLLHHASQVVDSAAGGRSAAWVDSVLQ